MASHSSVESTTLLPMHVDCSMRTPPLDAGSMGSNPQNNCAHFQSSLSKYGFFWFSPSSSNLKGKAPRVWIWQAQRLRSSYSHVGYSQVGPHPWSSPIYVCTVERFCCGKETPRIQGCNSNTSTKTKAKEEANKEKGAKIAQFTAK